LLAWFERHGRKDLPWQRDPSPYRVWVSEVMLQQTQVATVIGYFERFMEHYPTLSSLAAADLDQVLGLWSGLGYYARGRNLHRAAMEIRDRFAGEFPVEIETLVTLPGIGRSTAGAILALSRGQCVPILDGNVKRVLARYHGVRGWPGESAVAKRLWTLADAETPCSRVTEYTQAIMDFGATVCLRSRPRCQECPLTGCCLARLQGSTAEIPGRRPARQRPEKHLRLLVLRDETGQVLLEKRPPAGIWGGLWSLPECALEDDPVAVCLRTLGMHARQTGVLATLEHQFSHFRLVAEPVLLRAERPAAVLEGPASLWYNPAAAPAIGLAAPVKRLLQSLHTD
jgi:A/G-specific adenine glycosylase